MDYSDVSVGTPRVLSSCLELFNHTPEPRHFKTAPATPAEYASHPDFQFFSSVKAKHHYAYHKLKRESAVAARTDSGTLHSLFHPYSREQLLGRLRTYNALNWSVPEATDDPLTELFCAANGWVCESISRNNNTKNHLRCLACALQLVLKFNSIHHQPAYVPFQMDMEDIQELNRNLRNLYVLQIQLAAHAASCPWTLVLTPLRSAYYLMPHLASTNDTLISEYLATLRNLTDNLPVIELCALSLKPLESRIAPSDLLDFVRVSNLWLLNRHFKDNKENFSTVLERTCPPWLYVLAAMGWDLNIQKFAQQTVLLMICTKCNQRVFLSPQETSTDVLPTEPVLSSSKTLTPCVFPPHIAPPTSFSNGYLDDMEEDEDTQDQYSHKPWCLHNSQMDGVSFQDYFTKTVILLERNIGPVGEYQVDNDFKIDIDSVSQKRPASIDVNEGLERLAKLRKLYFVE